MSTSPIKILITIILTSIVAACSASLPLTDSQTPVRLAITNRVSLAPDGYELVDLRADEAQLYVTDSANQLYVLDRNTLRTIRTVAVTGDQLTLVPEHHRLYVAPGHRYILDGGSPVITVFDTQTLAQVGALPGRFVSIDSLHDRIYTGDPLTLELEQAAPSQTQAAGIHLFDGKTLAELAVGPQPGIPVYNPARDELLIVAYTVYAADAQTLTVKQDLLPELADQEMRWCTGCAQAVAATVFSGSTTSGGAADYLLLEVDVEGGGKGSGLEASQRWLDARTLEPLTSGPALQETCGSQKQLRPAIHERIYRSLVYSRYQEVHNVLVEDPAGVHLRQVDGLQLVVVDAQTSTGIAALSSEQNLLLDLARGMPTPTGLWPAFCLMGAGATEAVANADRTLYGAAGTDLLQIESIEAFQADGDQTAPPWDGGLPQWTSSDVAEVTLQQSPNFAQDKTLYWAAVLNGQTGLGVWRSTDSGESWQPVWQGLDHLRVTQLDFSPNFAQDHTMWATANFALIADPLDAQKNGTASGDAVPETAIQKGRSLWKSTNRGDTWSLVATAADDAGLPREFPDRH